MVDEFIEDSDLFRCNFRTYCKRIKMGAFYAVDGKLIEFQCANEKNHNGVHLIVVE